MDFHAGYSLGDKLGSGSFGVVHRGTNLKTGENVAIKMEALSGRRRKFLKKESKVYTELAGGVRVPSLHWYGADQDYNIMVIDLLGPSLRDLLRDCGRVFSLKTVLMLADQMLHCIEYMHSKSYIHRDVKPSNFVIGLGNCAKQVHILDFGCAKRYQSRKTGRHIPYKEGLEPCGTAWYASVNTHRGVEQSRRDDLESIGYSLLHFLHGSLPWQGHKGDWNAIMEKKSSTPLEDLCESSQPGSTQFLKYMRYCRSLGFEEQPDYEYLRRLLKELFVQMGYSHDYVFDWIPIKCELTPVDLEKPRSLNDEPDLILNVTPTLDIRTQSVSKKRCLQDCQDSNDLTSPMKKRSLEDNHNATISTKSSWSTLLGDVIKRLCHS